MTGGVLAEPEKPTEPEVVPPAVAKRDLGLYVFPETEEVPPGEMAIPAQQDLMLKRLMAEMLRESAEQEQEMEAPVELPKLDAPDLQRLLKNLNDPPATAEPRWIIGVVLLPAPANRLVVSGVMEDSAAEEAGLQSNDTLLDVNGIRLRDYAMLRDLLQLVRDQELVLGVLRSDEKMEVKITPRLWKAPAREATPDEQPAAEIAPAEPMREVPAVTPPEARQDDGVLQELRTMRGLMEDMLKELRKQNSSKPPRVRRVPQPPN